MDPQHYSDAALQFVAGDQNQTHPMSGAESDLASWVLMSGDLLGSSRLDPTALEAFANEGEEVATGLKQEQQGAPQRINSTASAASDTNSTLSKDQAKRQRRLEKNREIARNCRKRKREKEKQLNEELTRLREWNKQLQLQLNQNKDGCSKEAARKKSMSNIEKLERKDCSENDMKSALLQYKEMYSDFGRERSAAIAFHMSQLKSLLIPTTVSKMTMWSLQQEDEFYDEKKNQLLFGGGDMEHALLRTASYQRSKARVYGHACWDSFSKKERRRVSTHIG